MDNVLPPPRPTGHDFSQSSRTAAKMGGGTNGNNSHSNLPIQELSRHANENMDNKPAAAEHQDAEEEEEEPETQESFTQQLTQTNELTQLGFDDDNIDDDDAGMTQSQDCTSPTPIDPLTVPWGRLMPVGMNDTSSAAAAAAGGGGNNNNNLGGVQFEAQRPSSSRGATEMMPRSPTRAGSIGNRSRSPSADVIGGGEGSNAAAGGTIGGEGNSSQHGGYSPPCINFLGLKNLLASDRFNEYVLGRSNKADVTAQKLDVPPTIPTETNPEIQQRAETKRKRHDYVHAMISNRHCRVYCLLSNVSSSNNSNSHSPPEMEVFVEDTSGNGTLINGTTLLRRNERRKLHTGDVICLLNPKLLTKKIRSVAERKMYMSQYSYVFVNLYEQEARHGWGVMSAGLGMSSMGGGGGVGRARGRGGRDRSGSNISNGNTPSTTKKKGAVNARATKCHSITNMKGRRSLFPSSAAAKAGGRGNEGLTKRPPAAAQQNQAGKSLGSFLNNSQSSNANGTSTQQQQRRRRVEEEYDLRDLLGTGTCGEVRRAIHRRTGEERAVKIISIGGRGTVLPGMSSEKLTAIQAEAEILRSLDHPYVVKLFDMFISPGKAIYLVMELIRGGDLFDRIVERERYTEVQARRLFRRILTAVHYLHEERGIVHRDLKPENILVVDRRSDVDIKLTDFGLAKNMTAEGLKTFCGTPQYFAPEVLRRRHTVKGDGRYGKEIDCWSIGVILFILLSGSPPFDVSAGFDAVANAKVIFYEDQWRHVSREARDLVMRLLEKDPRRRMSVRDACRHKWVLVKDGDTHCHPLHDPVIAKKAGSTSTADVSTAMAGTDVRANVDVQDSNAGGEKETSQPARGGVAKSSGEVDESNNSTVAAKPSSSDAAATNPPSSPWRKKGARTNVNAPLSPISAQNRQNNQRNAQAKSAPQLSKTLSKDQRNPSIWPTNGNDKTITKAIQQSCHTSQPSPNVSPIHKRQLFDEQKSSVANPPAAANLDTSRKKMSKKGVESIKAAGNTLPTPVINKESRLVQKVAAPKKKVQSTLFASSKSGNKQQVTNASKPAAKPPEQKTLSDNKNKKRKSSDTPSVTPPGGPEQNNPTTLVFQLNKKHKVGGKYISPESRQNADATGNETKKAAVPAAAAAPAKKKKATLSDDELQSDFSDDEDEHAKATFGKLPVKSEKKKPLEIFLQKRKMDSIESSASFDVSSKPQQNAQTRQRREKPQAEEVPRPVSKESPPPKENVTSKSKKKNSTSGTSTDKKKVQSFLFGKPPPNDALTNGALANESENNNDAADSAPSQSNATQKDEGSGAELLRQASGGSSSGATVAKGKQRTIKSWFQPKK